MESKFKVGLYTSPHFVNFNERISVNGKYISNDFIANFVDNNQKYIDEFNLTFFEVTTAMAFEYFVFLELIMLLLKPAWVEGLMRQMFSIQLHV